MITGTLDYDSADLKAMAAAFGKPKPYPLWAAALVLAGLGAVIGFGAGTLADQALGGGDVIAPWTALLGCAGLVAVGAWRLGAEGTNLRAVSRQEIAIDESGIRLSTDKSETLMRWSYFTRSERVGSTVLLLTADQTLVLLRPHFFRDAASFAEANAIISAKVR